jgi:hypothetical protein
MTTSQGSPTDAMAGHPDIVALRERYDTAAGTPQAQLTEGLLLLAGGYAAISPWVIGFNASSSSLMVNDLIVGVVVMALTLAFASAYGRTHVLAWTAPAMGIWLIVAPWVMQGVTTTTGAKVSNIIAGACVLVFGVAMMGMSRLDTGGHRMR